MNHNIAAIIPALNESKSIANVVRLVRAFASPIVVDDGSSDGTGRIAEEQGAVVVTHPQNLGYGAALSSGLEEALRRGFLYAVTLDADGQHDPQIIEVFHQKLLDGTDLVIGHRDKFQRFSESIFGTVGYFLWNLHDPLCGMKAYRLELLRVHGPFDTLNSVGTEFSIKLIRRGIRFSEIAIQTAPRSGTTRYGSGLKPNLKILRALLAVLLHAR